MTKIATQLWSFKFRNFLAKTMIIIVYPFWYHGMIWWTFTLGKYILVNIFNFLKFTECSTNLGPNCRVKFDQKCSKLSKQCSIAQKQVNLDLSILLWGVKWKNFYILDILARDWSNVMQMTCSWISIWWIFRLFLYICDISIN